MHVPITSAQNPQVRWLRKLATDRRRRRREGLWVAEGVRLAEEVCRSAHPVRLWAVEQGWGQTGARAARLLADLSARGDPLVYVKREVLREISATRTPPGVWVAFSAPQWREEQLLGSDGPLVVLSGLQDPGNLGTIARSAEGAGAAGLVLGEATAEPGNPKALRASAGALLRLPCLSHPEPVELLRRRGYRLLAAAGDAAACYDEVDLSGRFALMLGQEGAGLPPRLQVAADLVVKIPMAGQLESLNVASACSVILFEAARQRRVR